MPHKVGNKYGTRTIPSRFLKANGAVKKTMRNKYNTWKAGGSASSRGRSGSSIPSRFLTKDGRLNRNKRKQYNEWSRLR